MKKPKATNPSPLPGEAEIRTCLALCLHAIEFMPVNRYIAKTMAGKLMETGTAWRRPEIVPQIIDMALASPPEFLESFQLLHSRDSVVLYLQYLREELCAMLEVEITVPRRVD